MNGLLYKYFRHNLITVILSVFAPVAIFLIMIPIALQEGGVSGFINEFYSVTSGTSSDQGNDLVSLFFLGVGYFLSQSLHSTLLKSEEMKKWANFTVASPKGVKGVVYTHYLFMFMVCGLTFITMTVFDEIYVTVGAWNGFENIMPKTTVFIALFYIELLFLSVELVFNSRFGSTYGGHVKFLMFVSVVLILFVICLFAPLPFGEDFSDTVFDFIIKLLHGDIPNWLMYVFSVVPLGSIGCYLLSYKISCKLYMKGVDSYEK